MKRSSAVSLLIRQMDAGFVKWTDNQRDTDPFSLGWRHGDKTKLPCSRREAEDYFAEVRPDWKHDDLTLYLNGRDDGVAGDKFRLPKPISRA